MSGDPYTKAQQLARGPKRYRRKVAGEKRWQRIIDDKTGPCRVCGVTEHIEHHHVIPRDLFGDDVPDNIAPVCDVCHGALTRRLPKFCLPFVAALTDAEYSYAIDKGGEDVFERVYGITYSR